MNWDSAKTLGSIKSICGLWTVRINSTTDCWDKKWQNSTRSRLFTLLPWLVMKHNTDFLLLSLVCLFQKAGVCLSVSLCEHIPPLMWCWLINHGLNLKVCLNTVSHLPTNSSPPIVQNTGWISTGHLTHSLRQNTLEQIWPRQKRNKVWVSSGGIHQSIDFFVLRMTKIPQNIFTSEGWKTYRSKGISRGRVKKINKKAWKSTAGVGLCRSMVWSPSMGTHVYPGDLCKMKASEKY